MTIHSNFKTLVLNADYQPLSVFPLSEWTWTDAVKALMLDRVTLVAEYDEFIPTPLHKIRYPSIIAVKKYQQQSRAIAFNKHNLWLRDGGICQYCATTLTTYELTFDHVHPRSKGGETTWDNIVCACQPCNARKANKSCEEVKMFPRVWPRKPKAVELAIRKRMMEGTENLHQTWLDYLYWDSELLPR
jgi:5-methylcytosine-specific restriction endonuclease McrA